MNTYWTGNEKVTTVNGIIQGIELAEQKVVAWLGVPYAKPPLGILRWKAPRELESWEGVRPAHTYSNSSVQLFEGKAIGHEDCLYLNIWRPEHVNGPLPVFVFAHGGGNTGGSGKDFSGLQLASATNSIVVTINYRLGAMGFFRHPALLTGDPLDDSGNYGLLDMIQALKWVRNNIAAFGGNAKNVTLAGQSAGARNALAAFLSPLGEGLFHKMFIMSGGMTTASVHQGEAKANELLAQLLIKERFIHHLDEASEWVKGQSAGNIAQFLYAQPAASFSEVLLSPDSGLRMEAFPHLFEDGAVLPRGGFNQLKYKSSPLLPIILGSTYSEFSIFALFSSYFSAATAEELWGKVMKQRELYEMAVQYGSELNAAFNVEQTAHVISEAMPSMIVFGYRFCWGLQEGVISPPARFLLGAPHGVDLPFLTGDYSMLSGFFSEGIVTTDNEPGRIKLSELFRSYLQNFLYTGNPNGLSLPIWKNLSGVNNINEGRDRSIQHKVSEILTLDASSDDILTEMIPALELSDIKSRLDNDYRLTHVELDFLKNSLFKGRFFGGN